jgi:ABC-type phosphate transport system ATPase subunit
MLSDRHLNKLWTNIDARLDNNTVGLISAPSGFGKSILFKHISQQNKFMYVDGVADLFDGSIYDNIFLGAPNRSIPSQIFNDFTFAFDEPIDDINNVLSTGQKQRICFMRSLDALSPYLLFDETLSGCQSDLITECIKFAITKLEIQQKLVMIVHNFTMKHENVINLNLTEMDIA